MLNLMMPERDGLSLLLLFSDVFLSRRANKLSISWLKIRNPSGGALGDVLML
jgi:hypothetical protein